MSQDAFSKISGIQSSEDYDILDKTLTLSSKQSFLPPHLKTGISFTFNSNMHLGPALNPQTQKSLLEMDFSQLRNEVDTKFSGYKFSSSYQTSDQG